MSVKLYALTCGYLTLPKHFMLEGTDGKLRVPVPSYLIRHRTGVALFDSGLHLATQQDPAKHVGESLAKYHSFDFSPGEDIGSRLRSIDVDPDDVTHVINSHLHFDHCGGNAQLPNARIVVQERELEVARRDGGERRGYLTNEFDTGQSFELTNGEYDVFGDRSVVCIPTYGHTPGHQSLRVRTELGGEFLLCGDACYLKESLDNLHLPGIIADPEAALAVFHQFRTLQRDGLRVMFGHDATFWAGVDQAPKRLG